MASTSFFKRHPKLSIVFVNILLLLIIFILFEIGLRIFPPGWLSYRMKFLAAGNKTGYGTDAKFDVKYQDGQFYSFTPNSTFKIYHGEYENTVNINNLGGRCTVPGEKADTTDLIPFTGDSFVMGVGVEDSENVVSITKKLTNYNFLNLGVNGTSMPIQRKIIDARYDELGQPSIVVYGFFLGNDFADIIKYTNANNIKHDSTTSPGNKAGQNRPASADKDFMWRVNFFVNNNRLLKRSYTLQFIRQKILNIQNKSKGKNVPDMNPVFMMMNKTDTAYFNVVKGQVYNEVDLLSKEPYKALVVLIPDRNQVNSTLRKDMCSYYGIDEKNIDPFLPNKVITEALDKYKIKYIDPTECISSHQAEGALYYTRDGHFTKFGQKILSGCIKDFLTREIAK